VYGKRRVRIRVDRLGLEIEIGIVEVILEKGRAEGSGWTVF
jgi:hypothetical protein